MRTERRGENSVAAAADDAPGKLLKPSSANAMALERRSLPLLLLLLAFESRRGAKLDRQATLEPPVTVRIAARTRKKRYEPPGRPFAAASARACTAEGALAALDHGT